MASVEQCQVSVFDIAGTRTIALVFLTLFATTFLTVPMTPAQTLTVLHNFTGGGDGSEPQTGMSVDRHGVFYGVTQYGGDENCDLGGVPGCGVLFQLKSAGSGWVLTPLHNFHDGAFPVAPGVPVVGPNGTVYGVTFQGGLYSAGLIYNARPLPTAPISDITFWNYTPIYQFIGKNDGGAPARHSPLLFDAAGNFYGTTAGGGPENAGVIYQMTPSGNGWTQSVLYAFTGGSDGGVPENIVFDGEGNMYGAAHDRGNQGCNSGCGTIFKLTPSGSGWTITTLHTFQQGVDGGWPGPLIRDQAGNLYGLTLSWGPLSGGTVWELSPASGGWTFSVLHSFPSDTVGDYGPYALALDTNGNLYGVTNWGGANNTGFLFKLSPANGGWTYTDLYDFAVRGGQGAGCYPQGTPLLDAEGNIYDTAEQCGAYGWGTIWEFTP